MAWISVDQSMIGDKLRTLHKTIGCSRNEAIGILVSLWLWGIDNAKEDGSIPFADLSDIAEQLTIGMNRELDPDSIARVLVETGWIEEVKGVLMISEYGEVCGKFIKFERERLAHNERTQKYRKRKRGVATSDNTSDIKSDVTEEKEEKKPKKKTQDDIYGEEFEKFWATYPRKDRKAEAFKCYKARIKDGYDPKVLYEACQNYADLCVRERKEKIYTLMGRTFLGTNLVFSDYIRPSGTTTTTVSERREN